MMALLHREGIYLWYYVSIQFQQIFKYYVIGIVLGSCLSVFAKKKMQWLLLRIDQKKWGLLGVLPASLLGIASPLCMYGTIPVAASFAAQGMSEAWMAAFMMSSILLNPQLIAYSMALGIKVVCIRCFTCFVGGVMAGVMTHYLTKHQAFFDFRGFGSLSDHDTDPHVVMRLCKNIGRNVKATGPMFLTGILLSAMFQRYVPSSLMTRLFAGNKAWGILMSATIGVPLYACGGGTIPLLQTWLADGMSLGGATAFMITGPATKITNLGALKIVLGLKHFVFYLIFVMAFALISGMFVQFLF